MRTNSILLLTVLILILNSCGNAPKKDEPKQFSDKIEYSHEKEAFMAQEAVQFNIKLEFGGKERLKGEITLLTNSSKGLITKENGDRLYFDNAQIYLDTTKMDLTAARFDAYTWSYFFLFPYKLSDQGTVWADFPNKNLDGKEYLVEKLTFEAGTGDAPDDWYVVYADKVNQRLHAAAYIVTANKTLDEAEADPHAIVYSDYQTINSVPIAHQWEFRGWTSEEGLTKELGKAVLSNIQFIDLEEDFFTPPSNFIEG